MKVEMSVENHVIWHILYVMWRNKVTKNGGEEKEKSTVSSFTDIQTDRR